MDGDTEVRQVTPLKSCHIHAHGDAENMKVIIKKLNIIEYRRRRRRGNWPNPVDAPLFYC